MGKKPKGNDADGEYIFVARITLKNGRVLYASSYGKKAFRIKVRNKPK